MCVSWALAIARMSGPGAEVSLSLNGDAFCWKAASLARTSYLLLSATGTASEVGESPTGFWDQKSVLWSAVDIASSPASLSASES